MFFDQVVLQNQCFQFGIGNNVFKMINQGNHFIDFRSVIYPCAKIRPHSVFQVYGLTHVNDAIVYIMHDINPRTSGEFF